MRTQAIKLQLIGLFSLLALIAGLGCLCNQALQVAPSQQIAITGSLG